MADLGALSELQNQQRPVRRFEKTYGKKKVATAQTRAMHFDLFGGGHENKIKETIDRLTINHDKDTPEKAAAIPPSSPKKPHTGHNPRLRGRRKAASSKKVATLTPEKLRALDPLLSLIQQEVVQDFQDFGRSIGKKYVCTKLGEGSYADVFKLQPKDFDEAMDLYKRGGLVIKIIPFNIDKSAEDDIEDLESITREVKILQTVDQLHGFTRCRGVHVVSGKYPDVLLEAFDAYKSTDPDEAINPNPIETTTPDQMFVILEMDDAGTPTHRLKTPSAFQSYDVFWQTVMILALAEKGVEFEHRDLHNGNVCYKPLKKGGPIDASEAILGDMTERPEMILGLSNLQITVIDYTLSRARMGEPAENHEIVFDPIEYWEENDSNGQSEAEKMQYNTYRKVRDLARSAEAQAQAKAEIEGREYKAKNKYERFLPKSNVMWLGYLLADLLSRSAYGRGASLPGSSRTAKRLQVELWRTLEEVVVYLNGTSPSLLPESADDLLATAVDQGWLSTADMAAFKAQMEE